MTDRLELDQVISQLRPGLLWQVSGERLVYDTAAKDTDSRKVRPASSGRAWWWRHIHRPGIRAEIQQDWTTVHHYADRALVYKRANPPSSPEKDPGVATIALIFAYLDAAVVEGDLARAWLYVNSADTFLPLVVPEEDLASCDLRLGIWDGSLRPDLQAVLNNSGVLSRLKLLRSVPGGAASADSAAALLQILHGAPSELVGSLPAGPIGSLLTTLSQTAPPGPGPGSGQAVVTPTGADTEGGLGSEVHSSSEAAPTNAPQVAPTATVPAAEAKAGSEAGGSGGSAGGGSGPDAAKGVGSGGAPAEAPSKGPKAGAEPPPVNENKQTGGTGAPSASTGTAKRSARRSNPAVDLSQLRETLHEATQVRAECWNEQNQQLEYMGFLWIWAGVGLLIALGVAIGIAEWVVRASPGVAGIKYPFVAAAFLGFFGGALSSYMKATNIVIAISQYHLVVIYTLLRMLIGAAGAFVVIVSTLALPLGTLSSTVSTNTLVFVLVAISAGFSERLFVDALDQVAENLGTVAKSGEPSTAVAHS